MGALLCFAWTGGSNLVLRTVAPAGAAFYFPCRTGSGLPGPGVGMPSRAARVKPTHWAGVHSYQIPGQWELEPAFAGNITGNRTGVLHIFLKALKWPTGDGRYHLRARGFVAFMSINPPEHWREHYTFRNPPEVVTGMRLFLRSAEGGWQREVAVEFAYDKCQRRSWESTFDFEGCVAEMKAEAPYWSNLGIIDLDFGPAETVDPNFLLLVDGWPRHVSLKAQLQDALAWPPAEPEGPGVPPTQPYGPPHTRDAAGDAAAAAGAAAGAAARPQPRLLRIFPYFHSVDVNKTARLVRWSHKYHKPLGFESVIMYVLPKHVRDVEAHEGLRALMADGRLRLVLWDEFPWYQGWRDFDLIVQSHAVLSQWGRHVRLLIVDPDEFFVPATSRDTVARMRGPGGCLAPLREECVMVTRRDVFPRKFPVDPPLNETSWWLDSRFPLRRYRFASRPPLPPKLLLNPNKVFPIDVHFSGICTGSAEVADNSSAAPLRSGCTPRAPCSWAPQDCVWIAHIANMHRNRRTPNRAQRIMPADWLWMLDEQQ
ncbi:hypothetical protein ABPG77_005354 [Micractinium sp. CCAP 211/92]